MSRPSTAARRLALAGILLAVLGCGGGGAEEPSEPVSDTGYVGTWQRGNERIKSTVSIVEHGGRYLFRWSKLSADGRVRVVCDWEGSCTEHVDGEQTSVYNFRTWVDEQSGRLRVECQGRVDRPTPLDLHYVDELVVLEDGLLLRSNRLEDVNGSYESGRGPRVKLHKISDRVTDPPEGSIPPAS